MLRAASAFGKKMSLFDLKGQMLSLMQARDSHDEVKRPRRLESAKVEDTLPSTRLTMFEANVQALSLGLFR